ncbi:MAG: ABC transporter ATP-binding protein [Bacteroidales bacterium]|jgi:ABC-2 type transport system ATP-binding protein|nr:ABC transporter ATP-binding protein [Bacteroidales bacterium]
MNEPILKIEHLSHRYSVKWAVKDLNLELPKRGIYGLLGSNGAGKSTTMNIACGIIKQTEGRVRICGIDTLADPIAAKRKIGFLPQKPPLHMELTVKEYLEHCAGLRLIPQSKTTAAVNRAMELCNLVHFKDRLISNLSGGYQQRVGIAQAIIHEPEIVILDEPTNGLDPNQILDVRGLIRNIAQDRTVILSTHILSEVQATCDHIFMIEQGTLIFDGPLEEFDSYIVPETVFVSLLEMPAVEQLQAIPDIGTVMSLGGTRYRIKSQNTAASIEIIVKESVKKNWKLNEIRLEKCSMDDIFAELSKKSSKM